jgi:hypothetical protein
MNERESGAIIPDDFQEKLIEYIKQVAVKRVISLNNHGMKRKVSTQTGGSLKKIDVVAVNGNMTLLLYFWLPKYIRLYYEDKIPNTGLGMRIWKQL